MQVTAITDKHIDDCVKILMDAYNSPPWNCQWTTEKATKYLSELINGVNFTGFIAHENDNVVGAVFGHRKTWWTNEQLMIDELFVGTAFQKNGYGKKLMLFCENYALENQIGLLVLMTNKYLPVFNFYERMDLITADQYVFMFKQL